MQTENYIIQTPRLLLREMRMEDAPFFFELNEDPEVTRYTGDAAFKSLKEAEDITQYVIDQYSKNGYGRWLVIDKETNNKLGWCGLKLLDDGDTDLGYRFMKKYWGKGYATESAMPCVDYAFNKLNLPRIIGRAAKDNVGSVNVLKKLGMAFFTEEDFHGDEAIIFELKKENYKL